MGKSIHFFLRINWLLVFLGIAFPFISQGYVNYVVGRVDVRPVGSSQWIQLDIGHSITENDSLKLFPNSVAEIEIQGRTILLNVPGEYSVSGLFQAGESNGSLSGLLRSQVQSNLNRNESTIRLRTAAGGVRASEAVIESVMGTLTSSEQRIELGKLRLEEGLVDEAIDFFADAFDFAFTFEEEVESAFYAGYSELVVGNPGETLTWFEYVLPIGVDSPFFVPVYLSAAQAHYELGNSITALDYLDRLTSQNSLSLGDQQYERFFRGLVMIELNDDVLAKQYIREAIDLDADSVVGKQAQQVLGVF